VSAASWNAVWKRVRPACVPVGLLAAAVAAFMGIKTLPVVLFSLKTCGVCMWGPNCPNCPVRPWHYVHPAVWWGAWNQVFRPGKQREAVERSFDWLILNAIGNLERGCWDTNAAAAGLAAKSQARINECLVCLSYLRNSECSWRNNVYAETNPLPNMTLLYGHLLRSNSLDLWLEQHKDQVALKRRQASNLWSRPRRLGPSPAVLDGSSMTNRPVSERGGRRP
jgi:hypothetical protein